MVVTTTTPQRRQQRTLAPEESPIGTLKALLAQLWEGPDRVVAGPEQIALVGQRIVYGGEHYHEPTQLTATAREDLARLTDRAPEHLAHSLEAISIVEGVLGETPQIGVFDTAFHQMLPPAAAVYPLPYTYFEQGVRRYGFHGISHQYAAQRAAQILGRDPATLDLITCHLGNGCSLAAIHHGQSIDTTMGFTPLEGIMMGTRSGSIDPGIIIYLARQGQTPEALNHLLNHASGLLGVSGISSDMRDIMRAMETGDQRAQLAFDIFVHRLRAGIGAMLASLGRLDALVFTGGIGEHAAPVREAICAAFGFMGLAIDAPANAALAGDGDIAASASAVRVLVVRQQENWAIACACWQWSQDHVA